ncbi:hypothetical protein NHF40_06180 [Maricaulaceae bacterium EIL42A08]|nr:hypothetical protein [Maricaulaceae bacterium EIL42A08]
MFGLEASLEGYAAAIGLVGSLFVFLLQQRRLIQLRKQENYLALELASTDLFRFEAQYGAVLAPYMEASRPENFEGDVGNDAIATNFYLQQLNLFEIAVRLRKQNGFEPRIFGSWVIWFFDASQSWYFRDNWSSWRENYTGSLRAVFDQPVKRFSSDGVTPEDRRFFFDHVAKSINCPVVRRWLDDLERGA